MNSTEYTYLLNNPSAVSEKQSKALETVVESFPYFQSARALYLKGLYNQDSYKYNFVLKQTAAHTTDRNVLFDFITSDEFTVIEKDIYEKKLALLLDIDVVDSKVESKDIAGIQNLSDLKVIPTVEFESSEVEFVKIKNTEESEITITTPEHAEEKIESDIPSELISPSESSETKSENESSTPEIEIADTVDNLLDSDLKIEEKLEIGKPIEFSPNEKHSFQEWLQLASFKPIERKTDTNEPLEVQKEDTITDIAPIKESLKQKKLEIIDKFIESNPKITPAKEVVETASKPIEIGDTSHLMTETLARVYLEQKKYSKAIQAYEILILKYPEKSIFFADRIKDIKILQQNNQ
ncbi:tetratricopeptide repeat protein [Flavobacterium sp.]|uniref:tetratricopeptide repeat protein n=1 Tax=Flavobacterium sp. TaxID=239 RepID=UPI002FDB223B